ncbi:hypothetical protein GPLA_3324 [Paraglaciecola polaris LMG 21857]|uniref:Uncharacterized protein n=1 Tax=Paraglaciecola polaris LMG 21857 TaxID=1129793 RepID=K6ZZP8_9ALTE|nr:hypothetical protein GPLA_3324 [Paraglaciecola polaris LMG 21857]
MSDLSGDSETTFAMVRSGILPFEIARYSVLCALTLRLP